MTHSRSASTNEGIQANTVTADVLAVGRGAKAVKIVSGAERSELLNAIRDLERALSEVNLPESSRQAVQKDFSELANAVQEKQPDPVQVSGFLHRVTQGLKSAGVAVKEVAGLIGPIEKIAGVLHLGLSALGLG